jgi:hypothetical protein
MAKGIRISDEHRRYAKVFLDFANAQSADEAGVKYIDNIKAAFDYKEPEDEILRDLSPDNNVFPTIAFFENKVKELPENVASIFHQIRIGWSENHGVKMPENLNPLDPKIVANLYEYKLLYLLCTSEVNDQLLRLSERDTRLVYKIASDYLAFLYEHNYILSIMDKLNFCLDTIIRYRTERVEEEEFEEVFQDFFGESYDRTNQRPIWPHWHEDGHLLIYKPPAFLAESFLKRPEPFKFGRYYDEPISYCFVEFLRDVNNQKYLKRCKHCGDFTLVEDSRRQFCPEPKSCKKQYYNKDVARRMKEDYRNPDSPKFKLDYLR